MSLLRKASIVTTPTSYENGKILSVKPVQSLGNELVTNGNFAVDSNWTKEAGWTISGGVASINSSTNDRLYQSISLESDKTYLLSVNVVSISTASVRFRFGSNGSAANLPEITTTGIHTFTSKPLGGTSSVGIFAVSGTTATIDSVSVVEVTDADFDFTRNSSATRVNSQGLIEDMQILSGDLVSNGDFSQIGSDLVTNGDFATDSNWVKSPSGLTISGGSANFTSGQDTYVFQDIMTIGKQYFIELEYNITSLTGVAFFGSNGGSGNAIISMTGLSGSGTLSGYITASATKLIIRSSTFDGSIDNVSVKEVGQDWSLSANADIQNNGLNLNGSGTFVLGQQLLFSSGLYNGKKVKLTYEVVVNDLIGTGNLRVGGYSGASLFPSLINLDESIGNHTIYTTINSTGINNILDLYITGGYTSGKITITNISLIEITEDTNLPRIDYTGGVGHWLFEPQRTNSLLQSNQFNESEWSKTNTSVSANETGVGGSTDAWLLSKNSSNALIRQFITTTGANSFSVYVKKGSLSWVRLFIASSTESSSVYVNLDNGLTGTSSGSPTVKVIPMDNGWYRCIITKDTTNINNFRIYPADADNDISGTSGNIYIQYAQLEQSSFATSYIPTSGSTVTRLQDSAFGAGSSDLINSTEGVLYAEIAVLADDSTLKSLCLSDGTSANRVIINYSNQSNRLTVDVRVGAVGQAFMQTYSYTITNFLKIGLKYKENDFALWVNGTEVATDSSGSTFSANTLNKLSLDNGAGAEDFFGKTKCVAVFKEALSNDELECLTGEGYDSFNALALANNYTII